MTGRAPQVGDTITTAEELDALPRGTVVLDAFGKACQRLADDGDVLRWWRCGHHLPNRAHLPAKVLHLDDHPHPPRPERVVKAEALPLETLDEIMAHLLSDGTRDGLIYADTLNQAFGRSARRRAASVEAGESL